MEQLDKDYTITDEKTGRLIYCGNSPVKAVQATFSYDTQIICKGAIQELIYQQIIALQERLN